MFPTDGNGNPTVPVNPSLTLSSFTGQNLAGIRSLYDGSAGGTGYSFAWAQDASNPVTFTETSISSASRSTAAVVDLDAISVVPEPKSWVLILGASIFFIPLRLTAKKDNQNQP